MRVFLKKYWIALLAILGSGLIIFLLITRERGRLPTPTPSPTPKLFVLEHSFPPPGKRELGDAGIALSFSFSSPIDLSSVVLTLKPYLSFSLFTDSSGKTLYVKPSSEWSHNVEYKMTIQLRSKEGEELASPIEHSFLFTPMTFSPLVEP